MLKVDKINRQTKLYFDEETQVTTLRLMYRKKEKVCLMIDHSHPMAEADKVRIFMITRIAYWHCQKLNTQEANMAFIERFYEDVASALAHVTPFASFSQHGKQAVVKPTII